MQKAIYQNNSGKSYSVIGNQAQLFTETKAFQLWMDKLNPNIKMDYLELKDSFVIKNGTVMLFATVLGVNASLNNKPISSYAFLRSDAVAMLPIITEIETGNAYTVVTEQFRFPYGDILFECPAGMLDDETGFTGVAAKEIEEELHEKINMNRLIHLGTTVMSGGGCPERMHYVAFEMGKSKKELEAMKGRKTGAVLENEDITLHVLPFNSNAELISALMKLNPDLDAKILVAITLWDNRLTDK